MPFEFQILDWLQTLHNPFLDHFMKLMTSLGDSVIPWIVVISILLIYPKTRRLGVILGIAMILDLLVCNLILKNLFARVRPYEINTSIQLLIPKLSDYSFPSGHTSALFTVVMVLYMTEYTKLWKVALIIAILVAVSRMYFYVHYPTDILGGIFVGLGCGYFGYRLVDIYYQKRTI